MSVNGDGLNDELRYQLGFVPDSAYLIVKDSCEHTYYDSRYEVVLPGLSMSAHPTWNGAYAPDSLSHHQPPRDVPEGIYYYKLYTYQDNSSSVNLTLNSGVELTRP